MTNKRSIPMTMLSLAFLFPTQTHTPMNIKDGQAVPTFQTKDVYGKEVSSTQLKGQKTLLSFQRNVGCPICNLQIHTLLQKADSLKKHQIQVILVYQSGAKNMLDYVGQESYPFTFLPDSTQSLYRLFSVEKSLGKLMKANFHGAMGKMLSGNKLFKKKVKMDGDMTMVGADFLISEEGIVKKAHYGRYVGDHYTAEQVIEQFNHTK
jgi:peroxiredoxin